jgi:rhomboid protease GluP
MTATPQRNSLLCPNCRRLVSRSAPSCPYCGLSRPGSVFKNNPLSRLVSDEEALFRLILGANITMFVLSLLVVPQGGALSPSSESLFVLGASGSMPVFAAGRWWTLISANYLHGGLLHIVFNMVALYNLAPLLIIRRQPHGGYLYAERHHQLPGLGRCRCATDNRRVRGGMRPDRRVRRFSQLAWWLSIR